MYFFFKSDVLKGQYTIWCNKDKITVHRQHYSNKHKFKYFFFIFNLNSICKYDHYQFDLSPFYHKKRINKSYIMKNSRIPPRSPPTLTLSKCWIVFEWQYISYVWWKCFSTQSTFLQVLTARRLVALFEWNILHAGASQDPGKRCRSCNL